MRFTGKLHSRNEERGFGFIRPEGGGQDIFVHVSALPGARWPAPEEVLSFEVALNRDGKKKAIDVRLQSREAEGLAADRAHVGRRGQQRESQSARHGGARKRSTGVRLSVIALVALCGWAFFNQGGGRGFVGSPMPQKAISAPAAEQPSNPFRCDGRTHCSQMRSCAEATYFLKNCPGTQMDGNGDGVPCEKQWCR